MDIGLFTRAKLAFTRFDFTCVLKLDGAVSPATTAFIKLFGKGWMKKIFLIHFIGER